MIERNKNPAGRISNMTFGMCTFIDGFIRIISLGFLHTRLPLVYARRQAMLVIQELKKRRKP